MPTLQTWWPQDFQTQKRWQTSSSFAMFCPSTGPTIRIVPLRNSWVVSHPSWLLAAMANRFSKRRMAVLMSSKLCQNPVVDPDPTERMPFYIPPLNISTTRIARFCHGFRVLFFWCHGDRNATQVHMVETLGLERDWKEMHSSHLVCLKMANTSDPKWRSSSFLIPSPYYSIPSNEALA